MRSAIIKRQDEQQNQTTTTNTNYIQNIMSIKKIDHKAKTASHTLKLEKNSYFIRKYMGLVHNKSRLQLDKNEQKQQS